MFTLEKERLHIQNQSLSLLFQFILSELITVSEVLRRLKQIAEELECAVIKRNSEESLVTLLEDIRPSLEMLIDFSSNPEDIRPWIRHKGCLGKMNYYSQWLLNQIEPSSKPYAEVLFGAINKAYHVALQCREQSQTLLLPFETAQNSQLCINFVEKVLELCQIFSVTPRHCCRLMEMGLYDENILFFIFRCYNTFCHVFPTDDFSQFLETLFPKGIEQIKEFLCQKYQKRGFKHLIPTIHRTLDECTLLSL